MKYFIKYEFKTWSKLKMHYTAIMYSFGMRNGHNCQANILWRVLIILLHISSWLPLEDNRPLYPNERRKRYHTSK